MLVLTIGLFPNTDKENIVTLLHQIMQYLHEHGVRVLLSKDTAEKTGQSRFGYSQQEILQNITMGIAIGGDGTLLNTAREVSAAGIPICGINIGKLGFLTEIELPNLNKALNRLIAGEYQIEEHLMLDAMIIRDNKVIHVSSALNDVVISKNGVSRMIKFNVFLDDVRTANYAADGLIIATATGSTGHSLSAGGPIINPLLKVMVLTPICSHTLHARPLIVSGEEEIKVEMTVNQEDVVLTIDGQTVYSLSASDTVLVKRCPFNAQFIRLNGRSYYETLRTKLWRSEKDADF